MNIIAIDPGTTTGLAWQYDDETNTGMLPADDVIPWLQDQVSHCLDMHTGSRLVDAVVVERFSTAGMLSKYGLQTIDLVGQIKGYCFALRIKTVIQTPASRKAWLDKAEFFDSRKRVIHENDALAHLLQYLDGVKKNARNS